MKALCSQLSTLKWGMWTTSSYVYLTAVKHFTSFLGTAHATGIKILFLLVRTLFNT